MSSKALPHAAPIFTAAFDLIADAYDAVFTDSLIGRAQRETVWARLDRTFRFGQRVLELNCGTGVDAIHLAERGVAVLACDASSRMIEVARRRLVVRNPVAAVEFRVLQNERIAELSREGPFDGAFSNFAGLNCVEDLSHVARTLARLLAPGSRAVICMLGRTAAWEIAWYLAHGNRTKALRRFKRGGVTARLAEGATVKVFYPSVSEMVRTFAPEFHILQIRGVGLAVPPSYVEPLAQRFPRVLRSLKQVDEWIAAWPMVRTLADHILYTFERVGEPL